MRSGSRRCPRSSATAPWSSNRHQRFHRRRADRKDFMLGDLDRGGEHYMGTAKRSLPTANKGEGHGWTGYCHRQWRPDRPGHFGHSLRQVRERHGRRIASVIHLAAYFDLTGEPNPKYEEVTVRGTEREPAPPQPPEVPPQPPEVPPQPEPPPPTPPPERPPAPPPPEIPPSPEQPPVEIPEPEATGGVRVRMTPAARRRAAELGLDPSGVGGPGPV